MDWDVTHKILYGPKRSWGPYTILWVIDRSINCHLAQSAMNYLLYYTQYMQICQTTCFCYCISKTKNEFRQNQEENVILIGPGPYTKILTGQYIANSSWHWGSYGSIWTGPSPNKYYMDRSFWGPYNIFLVTDRSIYCHMTRSDMNYLLYYTFYLK
jgi:hypothetical protein